MHNCSVPWTYILLDHKRKCNSPSCKCISSLYRISPKPSQVISAYSSSSFLGCLWFFTSSLSVSSLDMFAFFSTNSLNTVDRRRRLSAVGEEEAEDDLLESSLLKWPCFQGEPEKSAAKGFMVGKIEGFGSSPTMLSVNSGNDVDRGLTDACCRSLAVPFSGFNQLM